MGRTIYLLLNKIKMAKKIIRLTEADLTRLVKRVIKEQLGEMGGNSYKAVEQVINSCNSRGRGNSSNKTNGIADTIYQSVNGVGTDEERLISAFNSILNMDELCSVAADYQSTYGESLFSALDGDIDTEDVWSEISRTLRRIQQSTPEDRANQERKTAEFNKKVNQGIQTAVDYTKKGIQYAANPSSAITKGLQSATNAVSQYLKPTQQVKR
jgi:uncharacterized membrane-anchored protein YjiN (DUF445 family)